MIAATLSEISPAQFVFAVTFTAALAMLVFAHANKHGSRHPTAWGVATFLLAGVVVPLYFVHYLLTRRR